MVDGIPKVSNEGMLVAVRREKDAAQMAMSRAEHWLTSRILAQYGLRSFAEQFRADADRHSVAAALMTEQLIRRFLVQKSGTRDGIYTGKEAPLYGIYIGMRDYNYGSLIGGNPEFHLIEIGLHGSGHAPARYPVRLIPRPWLDEIWTAIRDGWMSVGCRRDCL